VLEAGADGICVVSAIVGAPDPAAAVRQFFRLIGSGGE
jgi:thiamine monophosphate synthase